MTDSESRASREPGHEDATAELGERLHLLINAAGEASRPRTPAAVSHWRDKVDEHRRAICALFASFSVIPTTVGEEPDELSLAKRALEATGWGGIYDDFRDVPDAIEQMASHIKSLSGEIPTGLPDGSESRPIDFSGEF